MKKLLMVLALLIAGVANAADEQPVAALSKREIIKRCRASVVHLYAGDPKNGTVGPKSIGTGFVVGPGGLIVTANHVVAEVPPGQLFASATDAAELNPDRSKAVVLRVDKDHDIALLTCSAFADAKPLLLDTNEAQAGDDVLLMGYPLGSDTVTSSRLMIAATGDFPLLGSAVSAKQLKLDGVVNNGESGAPIISTVTGNVVGIAHSKVSVILPGLEPLATRKADVVDLIGRLVDNLRRESNVGLSFAVSAEYVQKLIDDKK